MTIINIMIIVPNSYGEKNLVLFFPTSSSSEERKILIIRVVLNLEDLTRTFDGFRQWIQVHFRYINLISLDLNW